MEILNILLGVIAGSLLFYLGYKAGKQSVVDSINEDFDDFIDNYNEDEWLEPEIEAEHIIVVADDIMAPTPKKKATKKVAKKKSKK